MSIRWWWWALALCGCGTYDWRPTAPPPTPPEPLVELGETHRPYAGKPVYLAAARPLTPTTTTQPEPPNACGVRSPACDEKLRAALAALDLETLALAAPPTELQLRALELATRNVGPLLAPYPDLQRQQQELLAVATALPTRPIAEQPAMKKRMIELSDLIRVQLAAAE